ncbi:metallophosphoesterase [uncultured Algoriphagus sp.]|uniref:metallophosphoesterase family protein n=1 Tax=uncultured Algoriphagus sp. TaxID=417365 RepID=UPI0030ED0FF3
MNKKYLLPSILGAAMQLIGANTPLVAQGSAEIEIAFLSDIHLQDVYADLQSPDFNGILNPKTGKYATIRTMKSQLNSTRLFNENYFAFISALEDLQKKGIQLVVLPGDFTDDGQPMNVIALQKILEHYSSKFGMRFFLTTGNHDTVKPYGGIAGKSDFLGKDGGEQAIAGDRKLFPSLQVALSDQINFWGYPEVTAVLSNFGFFPDEKDLFWAHPFQELDYENYSFEQAMASANLEQRMYPLSDSGLFLPDASYVVEPIEGIWLLALDGNVFTRSGNDLKEGWKGSSVGFNEASISKKHQLDWIKKVAAEAEKRGKTLISFSHYPLVEFHDGASEEMKSLFGPRKFQLERVPTNETSELYATAGIHIHFAGHMHINDTGVYQDQSTTHTMYNIQVPSLAAFPPAYKTAKISKKDNFEIETIPLSDVDHMNEFFDLYRMEHRWLLEKQDPGIWDTTILASKNYLEYTRNHLIELTKSRFIPSDWPKELVSLLTAMSSDALIDWSKMKPEEGNIFLQEQLKAAPTSDIHAPKIIEDFYLVKNGDEIGRKLIPETRISKYETLFTGVAKMKQSSEPNLNTELIKFLDIFSKLYYSLPSDHFLIDLEENTIERID